MKTLFYKGLEYVKTEKFKISPLPFKWGEELIKPGHEFDQLGRKKRSSISFENALLKYTGRIGGNLLFSITTSIDEDSANDNTYICAAYVNNTTLLMQSSENGFWDIRY